MQYIVSSSLDCHACEELLYSTLLYSTLYHTLAFCFSRIFLTLHFTLLPFSTRTVFMIHIVASIRSFISISISAHLARFLGVGCSQPERCYLKSWNRLYNFIHDWANEWTFGQSQFTVHAIVMRECFPSLLQIKAKKGSSYSYCTVLPTEVHKTEQMKCIRTVIM